MKDETDVVIEVEVVGKLGRYPDSSKQASKFIRQKKQYYDNINTKYKQYNGRLPEGNLPSSWSPIVKYSVIILTVRRKKR